MAGGTPAPAKRLVYLNVTASAAAKHAMPTIPITLPHRIAWRKRQGRFAIKDRQALRAWRYLLLISVSVRFIFGVPNEIRTRVTAVKGRCPRPLDDGDALWEKGGLGGREGRRW